MHLKATHKKCSGCGVCRLSCTLYNFQEVGPSRALLNVEARFPDPGKYRVWVCNQCGICAEACPEEAIYQENDVFWVDASRCTICMSCVEACPRNVMRVHPRNEIPAKCISCGECAQNCPRDALEMVAAADG